MSEKTEEEQDAEEGELTLTQIVEAESVEFGNLVAEADSEEGVIPVKVISPGWGRTGYYPADTLRKSVSEGAFDKAHMNWDHISPIERPERSLERWAGEIIEGSVSYQDSGKDGPGVYARAFVFPHWRSKVAAMESHLGLSIIGSGHTKYGTVDGRSGSIFQDLSVRDVDFVTRAGAGGKVVSEFKRLRSGESVESEAPPVPETKPETKTEESKDVSKLVEQMVAEAVSRLETKVEESLQRTRAIDRARSVVGQSSLPEPAAQRVLTMLEGDTRLSEASADVDKIAREAVESELKYIEQFTPVHLRRPNIEESMGGDKYEKTLASIESDLFGDDLEDDKE